MNPELRVDLMLEIIEERLVLLDREAEIKRRSIFLSNMYIALLDMGDVYMGDV